MLQYIPFKKFKKQQSECSTLHTKRPVLDTKNEDFLQKIIFSPEEDNRLNTALENIDSTISAKSDTEQSNKDFKYENLKPTQSKKFPTFFFKTSGTKKRKGSKLSADDEKVITPCDVSNEATREEQELTQVLEDLNLSVSNNKAFFLSSVSTELIRNFTIVLKDLINGVPAAYGDLENLLETSHSTLSSAFEDLPSFIKVLVKKMPGKLDKRLSPELLGTASMVPNLVSKGEAFDLKSLVTNSGTLVTLLRMVFNTLKLRWPAFMGTNILLSLSLFVLLFILWYCHKRGKEERQKREAECENLEMETMPDAVLGDPTVP
ncbi:BgTH12-04450 [Blumeria graminis f. sp. triticale]|uniref:Bgt-4640 n=3 Tax=Blumeria graminis TaxID=34373 RepID=A0A061HDK4_BLUGR|nr:hypothetical protein BGT96224_4640 [Blumeria graminis f. sp. tritici 96224]CAD6498790.1 BgTH12-04450 [Blumeria graminis f. sp. triticale]VCU38902.1 Bgt-4640 [Blumeria graminis f. sp. tritici]